MVKKVRSIRPPKRGVYTHCVHSLMLRGACLKLARCLPEVGEVPAYLLACMPCRSECSENVDYDRNHPEDLAV